MIHLFVAISPIFSPQPVSPPTIFLSLITILTRDKIMNFRSVAPPPFKIHMPCYTKHIPLDISLGSFNEPSFSIQTRDLQLVDLQAQNPL